MPSLGLGTWQNTDPEACRRAVRTAIDLGYRHVDTAQAYDNESLVGEAIAAAEGQAAALVPREDLFVATKVHRENLAHDDVLATARASLDRLDLDYVDLLYVHWPAGPYDPEGTLSAFEELYEEGLIRAVGISNFEPDQVAEAVEYCDAPILANQVEMHPLLPQEEVRRACAEHGVEVVAYSPLARGAVMDVPELQRIAEKHDASPAQVSLAWLREKGVAAIPKATSEAHIRDNWQSLALELDAEDVETIDGIDRRERTVDPSWAPW
ncbi:MAG: aldo/keto reductase [Haloferacaceae archaeon]